MIPIGSGRPWPELQPDEDGRLQPIIRQRQLIYTTPQQRIHWVTAEFDGYTKEYFVDEGRTRAGLVVDRHGDILLVRQYRLLIDRVSWEIPGGAVDEDETPGQAAVRECLEETGVRCANPKPLVFYHVGMDSVYSPTHIFYSTDIIDDADLNEVHRQEVNGREWIPLERCLDMIFGQQIVDSFSIVSLLAYQLKCGHGAEERAP
jgi:8-oxo-dGTP pyrophosphatase MutT (NUDIX family)